MRYEVRVIDPAGMGRAALVLSDHSRSLEFAARAVMGGSPGIVSLVSVARGRGVPQRQIARFERLVGDLVRVKTELLRLPLIVRSRDLCPVAALRDANG